MYEDDDYYICTGCEKEIDENVVWCDECLELFDDDDE